MDMIYTSNQAATFLSDRIYDFLAQQTRIKSKYQNITENTGYNYTENWEDTAFEHI